MCSSYRSSATYYSYWTYFPAGKVCPEIHVIYTSLQNNFFKCKIELRGRLGRQISVSFCKSSEVDGQPQKSKCMEMLTRLLSLNLFEAWLKFNSCPSPNAGRSVCSSAVGQWVVSSWAQVFSLCLGPTLFMPEGQQELQTTEFFIKVTSWRAVPGSRCFLPRCVPASYITYPALTCSSLWEELFDPAPAARIGTVECFINPEVSRIAFGVCG